MSKRVDSYQDERDKIAKGLRYENAGIWFREPETKVILDSVKRKNHKGIHKLQRCLFRNESASKKTRYL